MLVVEPLCEHAHCTAHVCHINTNTLLLGVKIQCFRFTGVERALEGY